MTPWCVVRMTTENTRLPIDATTAGSPLTARALERDVFVGVERDEARRDHVAARNDHRETGRRGDVAQVGFSDDVGVEDLEQCREIAARRRGDEPLRDPLSARPHRR